MDQLPEMSFSGHETFPFRYAWIKKGVDGVTDDSTIFNRDDAMTVLGVGKNMVRSIRHWCLAAGVVEEQIASGARQLLLRPSALGTALFSDDGWDPFLEDPATLWLLHWRIATNGELCTTWYWAFSYVHEPEFSRESLTAALIRWVQTSGRKVADGSLKRDVDCFLRTYLPSRTSQAGLLEDSLDCPLVELGLLREAGDRHTFQFNRGPQRELPSSVLFLATVEFWDRLSTQSESLSVHALTYQAGSPGRMFQIDEDSMVGRLEEFEQLSGGMIGLSQTAGLKQLYRRGELAPQQALEQIYTAALGGRNSHGS